jgi:hypothetical protein
MSIRAGHLLRHEDDSGVSGIGRVAEWVEFSDGEVVVHWLSHTPSTNHYRNMKQVEAIHGHGGATEIIVDWEEPHPREAEAEVQEEVVEIGPVEEPPKNGNGKKPAAKKAAAKKEKETS